MVADALSEVKTITPEEALSLTKENKCNLIDIRDAQELERVGKIEGSHNISRGLLEFSIHPESVYVQSQNIDLKKEIVLFCAAGRKISSCRKNFKRNGFSKCVSCRRRIWEHAKQWF